MPAIKQYMVFYQLEDGKWIPEYEGTSDYFDSLQEAKNEIAREEEWYIKYPGDRRPLKIMVRTIPDWEEIK